MPDPFPFDPDAIVSYPGTLYSQQMLADVINASWKEAQSNQEQYSAKIAGATTGWLDTAEAPAISASTAAVPTISEPIVLIPGDVQVDGIMQQWDVRTAEMYTALASKFGGFMLQYFPNESSAYAAAEAWLTDALANPDQVLPEAIANLIWEEDRSRILVDASRATDEVVAQWAAKGHPLAPGRAAYAATQIQQAAQQELAKSSRAAAIRTFDLAYDKMKFVVSSALALRQQALAAALGYIQALVAAPAEVNKLVSGSYDSQSRLISAASSYYGAQSEAAKVVTAAHQYNASATQDAASKNQASELAVIDARLKAMLAEATALAQSASALYNNLHASLGSSVGFSESFSTSL